MASMLYSEAQTVTVMTYNIRLDTPADSLNQWPKRASKVYALIQKYNPDMLGIQEALHHQLMDLMKNLPEYNYMGVGREDGKTKGEYSAVLYKKKRFEVMQQNTFWLSKTPDVPGSKDWDAAITRVASWGILKDNTTKTEFFILNTHFDHLGKLARKNSAILLKQKTVELSRNLPVILTGDFNCLRDEPPYETMMNTEGIALIDASPGNPIGTFCGFKVNGFECKVIDYILYTDHWVSSSYHVIEDNDGMYYPSDHRPVITTLQCK